MGLSGWNKEQIIKFTIDHNKVESPLTDFPVLLNLTDESGVNDFDCSDVFEKIDVTSLDDNFSGNDGDPPNEYFWDTTFDATHTGSINIQNNKLKFNITSGGSSYKTSYISSTYKFIGDFDIQLDFDSLTSGADAYGGIEVVYTDSSYRYLVSAYLQSGARKFRTNIYNSGNTYSRTNDYGKLRLKRSGSTLYTYTADGDGGWVARQSGSYSTKNSTVHIFVTIDNTNTTTTINFDNFKINSGTTPWASPNRKKIAVVYPAVQEHWVTEYDYNTKLLIHSDDDDESTVFADSSYYNRAISVQADTHHDTTTSVFGKSSIRFVRVSDTEGGYLSIAASSDLDLKNKNFTIEFWLYCSNLSDNPYFIAQGDYASSITNFSFNIRYYTDTSKGLAFRYSTDGSNTTELYSEHTLTSNVWVHIAVVRASSNILFFVDGALVKTVSIGTDTLYTSTHDVNIGGWRVQYNSGTTWGAVDGYMDEVRYSVGIARWYNDFTPESNPYKAKYQVLRTYEHGQSEQLYCEIERWDQIGKSAQLWVKVPKVLSNQPTDIYLYYDKTQEDNTKYVGDTGSSAAQHVWDENFVAVYHLSQDPSTGGACIKDSTSNEKHGTPYGSMTSTDLVDANVGKGLDFDGSDDYITIPNAIYTTQDTTLTIELSAKGNTTSSENRLFAYNNDGLYQKIVYNWSSNSEISYASYDGSSNHTVETTDYAVTTYHNLAYTAEESESLIGYIDGVVVDSTSCGTFNTTSTLGQVIGAGRSGSTNFYGILREVRLSNTVRTETWLKTNHYSTFDSLLALASGIVYTISGYVKQYNQPVSRKVYCYDRRTGELMDSCMSSDAGYYLLHTTCSGAHNLVCLDDDGGYEFEDLIISKIMPEEI